MDSTETAARRAYAAHDAVIVVEVAIARQLVIDRQRLDAKLDVQRVVEEADRVLDEDLVRQRQDEQQDDLRQEGQHGADPADHRLGQERHRRQSLHAAPEG